MKLIAWLLLAVVSAVTDIMVVLVPVVTSLWLWDTIAPHVRQYSGHRAHPSLASAPARIDLRQWTCHLAQMVVAMYAGMAVYKIGILLFNLTPLVALVILGR